jgi:acetoacetyl-CoA synthetase
VELPVKQIVSGKIIKPSGTLANPESLRYYEQFAKVEEVLQQAVNGEASHLKSKL